MFGVNIQLIFDTVVKFAGSMINNLQPTVLRMFFTLMSIDLVLSFLFDESRDLDIFLKLTKKFLYYGFFLYIIKEYKDLIFNKLFAGFVQLGNLASTGSMSTELSWGLLNRIGVDSGDLAGGLLTAVGFSAMDLAFIESAPIVGLLGIASYLLFFLMLYVQVFTVFIKFYLTAGFAYILMPFSGFDKTKDITLKALNGLLACAVEIFIMVVLLQLLNILDTVGIFTINGSVKETIWTRWVLCFFMFFLLTKTGSFASGLMSGALATLGIGAGGMSSAQSRGVKAFDKATGVDSAGTNKSSSKKDDSSAYKSASNFIGKFKK